MNKIFLNVTMTALLGITLGGCNTESLVDDYIDPGNDEAAFSRTTVYLKDANGTGVAGITYSCQEGMTSTEGDITTSGTTPATGDMPVAYWPGSSAECIIITNAAPELYLYTANGPLNDIFVNCTGPGSDSFTGEDGHDGSINNKPNDTCSLQLIFE